MICHHHYHQLYYQFAVNPSLAIQLCCQLLLSSPVDCIHRPQSVDVCKHSLGNQLWNIYMKEFIRERRLWVFLDVTSWSLMSCSSNLHSLWDMGVRAVFLLLVLLLAFFSQQHAAFLRRSHLAFPYAFHQIPGNAFTQQCRNSHI